MLTFKSFLRYSLSEELTPQQKKQVAKWPRDPKALGHTDHFFGAGNDDVIEPLQGGGNKSEPHRAVERHLGHEISPEDYKAGKTKDKYGREVKIGSMLQKSKADPKLVQQFANDSTRQLKSQNNLTVHVTRSAAGVAGQTSRGQSWRNESCKNFEDGSNRSYLKNEVKHGTVVAYLKNQHGQELARATFQPYHNEHGQVVYRHDSYYGPNVKEFHDHAKDLEKRLSASHEPNESIYRPNPKVYNDTGVEGMMHPNASAEQLHKALDHKDPEVRMAAIRHSSANAEHITKGLNDKDPDVRMVAARHSNANAEHLHKALNDKDSNVRIAAVQNPNANAEHLHKALDDQDVEVRRAAVKHPGANAEHITKGLNDENRLVRRAAIWNPRANAEHITKALNDSNSDIRYAAMKHDNATREHLVKASKDRDDTIRFEAQRMLGD